MNIGIVTTWFERGAAYVSRSYLETLSAKHRVFIYARGGEEYATEDPVWNQDYVTWGKRVPGPWTRIDWEEFAAWLSASGLEMVIFNEQRSWDVIARMQQCSDVILGAYVDYYTAETIPLFGLYDFLLCNTRRHYDVFRDRPQCFYIPWGTDCQLLNGTCEPIREGEVTFFHSAGMGGINLRKGTDILVRAFQQVSGPARLVIHSQVGVTHYGSVADLICKDVRIEFIEGTVGVPGLYHLGDVYVYPSRLEGIGLTIAEALASGLPVITTDAAPMNEFVVHEQNGRLVEVARYQRRSDGYYWPESICNENALTEAMQFYVDNCRELRGYRRLAREHAAANLDWKANSAHLSDVLQSVRVCRAGFDSALWHRACEYSRHGASRPSWSLPLLRLLRKMDPRRVLGARST